MTAPGISAVQELYRNSFGAHNLDRLCAAFASGGVYIHSGAREGSAYVRECTWAGRHVHRGLRSWVDSFARVRFPGGFKVQDLRDDKYVQGAAGLYRVEFTVDAEAVGCLDGFEAVMRHVGQPVEVRVEHLAHVVFENEKLRFLCVRARISASALQ